MDWRFEDNGNADTCFDDQRSIMGLLSENKFDLVINLPARDGGSRAASSFMTVTRGYEARRRAVEYSVPLITDIKCTKLLIEVAQISSLLKYYSNSELVYLQISSICLTP